MGPSWVTKYVLMALNMTWIQGHPKWVMEGYFSRPMRMPHTRQHGTLQNGKRTIAQVISPLSSPPTFQETVANDCTFAVASRKADVALEGDGLVVGSAGPMSRP